MATRKPFYLHKHYLKPDLATTLLFEAEDCADELEDDVSALKRQYRETVKLRDQILHDDDISNSSRREMLVKVLRMQDDLFEEMQDTQDLQSQAVVNVEMAMILIEDKQEPT